MPRLLFAALRGLSLATSLVVLSLVSRSASAQETGTVTGTVTRAGENSPLPSVSVTVQSTGQSTVTRTDGKYTLRRVPAGP